MATIADQIKFIITGDNSGLVKATAQSDSAIEKMTQSGGRNLQNLLLGFVGVAGGAFAFGAALKSAVSEALDSERAFRALSVAVNVSGDNWQAQEKGIRAFLNTFQRMTRFTDEEGAQALQVLIQAGMGVKQALSLMNTVADLAAAKQMDLGSAAELIGRAFNGATESLGRYGLKLSDSLKDSEKFPALIDLINERMAGQAKLAQNASDSWALFSKNMKEFGEKVGTFTLPALTQLAQMLNSIASGSAFRIIKDMFLHPFTPVSNAPDILAQITSAMMASHTPTVGPITTPSKDVFKKEAEERAKTLHDALKTAQDQYREDERQSEQEADDERLAGLDAYFRFEKQKQEKAAAKRREDFDSLINNAHRFAFELGRVLGDAAENFIHQMIEGLATIGANFAALKKGGIGGIAGGFGIAGTIAGVIGSIVDMFSSGAKAIQKSNLEVVQAIKDWITNLRSQTKEELIAGRKDIATGRAALEKFADLSDDALKKNSDEFLAMLSASPFKDAFAAAAEAFKQQSGRRGSVEEVLFFWDKQLQQQEKLFDALVGGKVKSPDDVRALLKEQTHLDFQTGRMWIDYIAKQNNWTPEQQKALFEELFNTLADSGNASVQELMALREIITGIETGQTDSNIQEERQLQITRSVAGITENQANQVVGHLATINAVIQSIYELMQGALENFTAAASGIPAAAGGVTFGPGAIVVNGGANATAREIVDVLSIDLRAKGVKI